MTKNPPKRLGRGLSSLMSFATPFEPPAQLENAANEPRDEKPRPPAVTISVGTIRPNPFQPRKEISPNELKSLAASISSNGIIQPVIVRTKDGNVYELIAGERRWRAAQMAGLSEIPAIVREASDQDMLEIALTENIFREDLNPIDRATAYKKYCDEFSLTPEQVASKLGEDRSTVTNYIRLLDLPQEVKDWVTSGQLSMGHARCLLAIRSPSDLVNTARQAINLGLSVRALEKLVRDRVNAREAAAKPIRDNTAKRPQIRALEEAFTRQLGTKVEIDESKRKGAGKLIIHYYSLEDFDRLAERLGVQAEI
ncbi:MAG TPA: ParB/RepB/Spo0J family partition protein [Phycisphaerae bacterium]|nr:ParB/RepB/Spo0J family partition protein [Phycisphaerae bacterium]HRR84168.1 ParB/RepB/Spo0J family partition protein [Phycisphaerae bacterium]